MSNTPHTPQHGTQAKPVRKSWLQRYAEWKRPKPGLVMLTVPDTLDVSVYYSLVEESQQYTAKGHTVLINIERTGIECECLAALRMACEAQPRTQAAWSPVWHIFL